MIRSIKIFWFAVFHMQLAALDYTIIQEAATIDQTNPKYVTNVSAITYRAGRGARYLTNVTGTTMQEWNNNVTYVFEVFDVANRPNKLFELAYKMCDAFKVGWILKLIRDHSEMRTCPIPPETYHFTKMDADTSSMPFLRGLTHIKVAMTWRVTATKELMSTGSLRVHIVPEKRRDKIKSIIKYP